MLDVKDIRNFFSTSKFIYSSFHNTPDIWKDLMTKRKYHFDPQIDDKKSEENNILYVKNEFKQCVFINFNYIYFYFK